jgi:glycosyltransferase involved in cell wall biosynthesis
MNVGGTARYIGAIVKNVPGCLLATGNVQGAEVEDPNLHDYEVIRVPHLGRRISIINDFRAWKELRRIIEEIKPVIIHTHTFKAGLLGRLVGGNYKRIHTFHGHLFGDESFSKFEKYIITLTERWLAKRTDILISVGKKVGVELRVAGIGAEQSWRSVAPGVDPLPYFEKPHARKTLGLSASGIVVGWMARMTEVKNPLLFLEVARRMPDLNFAMAGGGNMFERIKIQAPKNVSVVGWADAPTFWSAMDCAISTSDNEGMPIALIEAQLAGLPVVATDVGSTSEIIVDGVTGILTSKNPDSIIKALRKIVANERLRISMGTEAAKNGRSQFSPQKMITAHAQIYNNLTSNF